MEITYLTHNTHPLMVGDTAPAFYGLDQHNTPCILWGLAGEPIVLCFVPSIKHPACEQLLLNFAKHHVSFVEAGAVIVVIGLDEQEEITRYALALNLPYPVLSAKHLQGKEAMGLHILRQYGLLKQSSTQPGKIDFMPCTLLIDENSRIHTICPIRNIATHPQEVLQEVEAQFPPRASQEIGMQAPVLLINNVLSKQECKHLINVWESQGNVDSGSMITVDGKTVGIYDYNKKIRRDHFIKDAALLKHLDITIRRRIFPQIQKAFHFECTRREEYKIACYDAGRGGYFRKHRDNTTPATAHRVWAMSLNLNSEEYEGGHVKFPEFSDNLYKPATGSALIFSGALMHEATDVTKGQRFVLLQFFYGDKESELRDKNRHLLVDNAI